MRLRYSRVLGAARRTEGPVPFVAWAVRFALVASADFAAVAGRLAVATGAEVLVDVRAVDPLVLAVAFAPDASFDFAAVVGLLAVAAAAGEPGGVRAADPLTPLDLPAVRGACELCEVLAERGAWAPGRRAAPFDFFAMNAGPPDEVRRGPVYPCETL
jgi:hypothetical protein